MYLTDGLSMFEVAYDRMRRNFGRRGGWLHEIVVRDREAGGDSWRWMGPRERASCHTVPAVA